MKSGHLTCNAGRQPGLLPGFLKAFRSFTAVYLDDDIIRKFTLGEPGNVPKI